MKSKVYESNDTNFGKNELNNQNNLQLNYQFKFRYLNENVHIAADKLTMDLPIDLSIKRTSPDESSKLVINRNEKEIDKKNCLNQHNDNHSNDNKNEAKLLPYLLMSSNHTKNLTSRSSIDLQKTKLNDCKNNEASSTFHSDADLLKYNKKKLFLASVRKQSSSIDISNLSSNGTRSSSSSSSNSPNSTPSHQSTKSDRRNSSSSISSTNLTLSPNSDNQSNDDLDNQPTIKELENLYKQQNDLMNRDKLFNRSFQSPNSFNKKFEYFSKYYKINELQEENLVNNNELINKSLNGDHLSNSNKIKSSLNKNDNSKIQNNLNYLKCIERSLVQTCNNKTGNIGLKRSFSESYLLEQKQENIINLLTYKRRQLKKCRSENDLSDLIKLYRCNEKHLNGIKLINGNSNNTKKESQNENKEKIEKLNQQLHHQKQQQQPQQSTIKQQKFIDNNNVIRDYQRNHYDEQYELKRQLIDKQQKEQLYLRNQTINDDITNYTKQLIRNQKSIYQFSQFNQHHLNNKFGEFDKFSKLKSNSLPLNLQLNRNKASLNFNNSQLFNNKKSVINNEKTGKRKFTKLASDEDEEDLEDEDENEDNIIVDHLSNTASSSVSPNSIQSNSDLPVINKQLLTKHHHLNIGHQLNNHLNLERHHLETHSDNGLVDLRLPFINHSSHLNRRSIQNNKQNFGNLPDLLPTDLINEASTNDSKDGLNSWKFYKDYYYLLLNQPDSPAKLNALQWIMKDLNEKNNNHINLADDWTLDPELVKLNSYKQSYSLDNGPINLTTFNNLNRSTNSNLIDQPHHQLLNNSCIDKFNSATNSPPQPINLTNLQLTPENYLQYVKMNENLINNNQQLQIITGQSYLNLDSSNHCLPPGTPNSFQDRKRISRPLTGRHVRQGTGASPTTLANLRSMIKERQKFRELNGLGVNNGKKFRKKRK